MYGDESKFIAGVNSHNGFYMIDGGNVPSDLGTNVIYFEAVTLSPISKIANSDVSIDTSYGTIDVIWLDTQNNVISEPNKPVLTSNGESMTPVTWKEDSSTSTLSEVSWTYNSGTSTWSPSDSDASSVWYSYNALSSRNSDGTTIDNLTSQWANAKTENGSYFVWIPRFAYRITYYESESSTIPTGYYDGYGMWNAEEGTTKLALDTGVETVVYNGKSYIVHPAFTDDSDIIYKKDSNGNNTEEIDKGEYDLGGWNYEL